MCVTEEEIRERLKDLPEVPNCLMTFAMPGEFHGVVDLIHIARRTNINI